MFNLTAYFDESGHLEDPALNYVGMAGFVGQYGAWLTFEERWQDTLDKAGLKQPMHMKDFAHCEGQFKYLKGKEAERRLLLRRFLEIILESGCHAHWGGDLHFGFSFSHADTAAAVLRSVFSQLPNVHSRCCFTCHAFTLLRESSDGVFLSR